MEVKGGGNTEILSTDDDEDNDDEDNDASNNSSHRQGDNQGNNIASQTVTAWCHDDS